MRHERRAIESTYTDACDVSRFEKVTEKGMTMNKPVSLYENLPCALSQKTNRPTQQSDTANHVNYDAKLFVSPETVIPPGSEIAVRRCGRTYTFVSSGEGFVYPAHQEIMLLRKDKA